MTGVVAEWIGEEQFAIVVLLASVSVFCLCVWRLRRLAKQNPAWNEAQRLVQKGVDEWNAGNKVEGLALYRKAGETFPWLREHASYECTLADLEMHAGKHDEAELVYRRLLARVKGDAAEFPGVVDGFASLALYGNLQRLFAEAESLLRGTISRWPDEHSLKGTLGSLLVEQGRIEEGRILLEDLYARSHSAIDRGICAAYLSLLAKGDGKAMEAEELRKRAREHLPVHPLLDRLIGGVTSDVKDAKG